MQYLIVKQAHLLFVSITIILFNLRFWLLAIRTPKPLPKILKVLPHINDTLLLCTGLWLMKITHYVPFGNANWLGVKILLVITYVFIGIMTLRAKPRTMKANVGYVLCLLCLCCIVYLAIYKAF